MLSTLPEVALRIRDTAQKDDISPKEPAGVVSEDPGLEEYHEDVATATVMLV